MNTNKFILPQCSPRWSKKKRKIPDLGDEDTPFEQVDNFYNFW